jgi:ubiquitin thioesterase protein OTUB1
MDAAATYEDVEAQQDAIRRAVEASQPLVSEREDPAALLAEYADNALVLPKLREFAARYAGFRRVRGDGSCFYRAFLVGVAEAFAGAGVVRPAGHASAAAFAAAAAPQPGGGPGATELARLPPHAPAQARYEATLAYVRDSLPALAARGWSEYTTVDFRDAMLGWLWGVGRPTADAPPVPAEAALGPLGYAAPDGDAGGDAFFVLTYARCLTALALRAHEDEYEGWVAAVAPGCASVKEFCDAHVEAVRTDADQLQALALARAWGVVVRVAYVDASPSGAGLSGGGGSGGLQVIDLPDGDAYAAPSAGPLVLHLLYRPGHYDVAYPHGGGSGGGAGDRNGTK